MRSRLDIKPHESMKVAYIHVLLYIFFIIVLECYNENSSPHFFIVSYFYNFIIQRPV